MTKQKLVFTYWGAGIALGIYGTKAEVSRTAAALYNNNATDSEPIWLNDDAKNAFAYVLTDWPRLKKGYTDLFIVANLPKRAKLKRNLKKVSAMEADQRLESIVAEPFLDKHREQDEPYKLGFIHTHPDDE